MVNVTNYNITNYADIVNYTKDIEHDFNIKLLILLVFLAYSLFILWYWNRKDIEYLWQYILKRISLPFAYMYFAFLPYYIYLLDRAVDVSTFLVLTVTLFSIVGVIAFSIGILFGGEKLSEFLTGKNFYRNR